MVNWLFPPLLKAPVDRQTLRHINNWVSEEGTESRAALGEQGMGKEYRQKALQDLQGSTVTKNIGGEKHYLLHRSMGDEEFGTHVRDGAVNIPPTREFTHYTRLKNKFTNFTSWGPDATQVPRDYRTHMVSVWVPESHISFYPLAYKDKFRQMFPSSDANNYMEGEKEVIVKPGKFPIVHQYSAKPRRNADGERIYNLTFHDATMYEHDLRAKLGNGG